MSAAEGDASPHPAPSPAADEDAEDVATEEASAENPVVDEEVEVRSTTSTPPLEEQLGDVGAAEDSGGGGGLSPVSQNGSVGGGDDAGGAAAATGNGDAGLYSPLSEGGEEALGKAPEEEEDGEIGGGRGGERGGRDLDNGWKRTLYMEEEEQRGQRKRRRRSSSRDGRRDRDRSLERDRGAGRPRNDLPRYDVRNIINSRRGIRNQRDPSPPSGGARRNGGDRSVRRSWSRSRSWSRGRRRPSWSRSRSRSWSRSHSRSRSPPKKKKKGKKGKASAGGGKKHGHAGKGGGDVEVVDLDGAGKKGKKRKRSKSPAGTKESGKKTKKKGKDKTGKKGKKTVESQPALGVADVEPGEIPVRTAGEATRGAVTDAINSVRGAVANKEVFASGDKILVSVNFRKNRRRKKASGGGDVTDRLDGGPAAAPAAAVAPAAADQSAGAADEPDPAANKPVSCFIDLEMSPYGVVEPSPQHELVDLGASDEEEDGSKQRQKQNATDDIEVLEVTPAGTSSASKGLPSAKSTSEPAIAHSPTSQVVTVPVHRGPCTPPLATDHETMDFSKGPETPPPPENLAGNGPSMVAGSGAVGNNDDSYDPFDPTESPTLDDSDKPPDILAAPSNNNLMAASTPAKKSSFWDDALSRTGGGSSSTFGSAEKKSLEPGPSAQNSGVALFDQISKGLLMNGGPNASSISRDDSMVSGGRMLNGSGVGGGVRGGPPVFNINAAALASAAALVSATTEDKTKPNSSNHHSNASSSLVDMSGMDMDCSPYSPGQASDLSEIFEPPKATGSSSKKAKKAANHKAAKAKAKAGGKPSRSVQMKLIDDKLKIIDEVPTSAVEMAVKEKFLKKVQRQERIVEEIKMVLKPHYNRKKITKESYKEIMRKCVPKVCHNKNREINTNKIQKMVEGYVKKYRVKEKKKGG